MRRAANGPTKQLAFRLPLTMVAELDRCTADLAQAGLPLPRAEVVRMLLSRAVDAVGGDPQRLLKKSAKRRR